MTSALVIGLTMLVLNRAGTHYTKNGFPTNAELKPDPKSPPQLNDPASPTIATSRPRRAGLGGPRTRRNTASSTSAKATTRACRPGRYLVNENGNPVYRTDVPISREAKVMDNGNEAPKEFTAPQPRLFANIIEGILGGTAAMGPGHHRRDDRHRAGTVGVSALPVAVGMYLSLGSTTPIFIGGMMRLIADRMRGKPKSEAETETSPGVLLASGYIAGGTLCGLIVAFFAFLPESFNDALNLGLHLFGSVNPKTGKTEWKPDEEPGAMIAAVVVFAMLGGLPGLHRQPQGQTAGRLVSVHME